MKHVKACSSLILVFLLLAFLPYETVQASTAADLTTWTSAGTSCSSAYHVSLSTVDYIQLIGNLRGGVNPEIWYQVQLGDHWKIDASILNYNIPGGVSLELRSHGCSLVDSASLAGPSQVSSISSFVTDSSGTYYFRVGLLSLAGSGTFSLAIRFFKSFIGGDMIKRTSLKGDPLHILLWTKVLDDPFTRVLNETFRVTASSDSRLFFGSLAGEGSKFDALIIKDPVGTSLMPFTSAEMFLLEEKVSEGAALIVLGSGVVNQLNNLTGISVGRVSRGPDLVQLSPNQVSTYGVSGLSFTSGSDAFAVDSSEPSAKVLATFVHQGGSAFISSDVGSGTVLASAIDVSNLKDSDSLAFAGIISNIVTNLQQITAALSSSPYYFKNPRSQFLSVLSPGDSLLSSLTRAAYVLNGAGFSVFFSNLMSAVGGGYYASSINIEGSKLMFDKLFGASVAPRFQVIQGAGDFAYRNLTHLVIPPSLTDVIKSVSFPSSPVALDGTWPPPQPTFSDHPKLTPNQGGVTDMKADNSVESLLNATVMRQSWGVNGKGVNVALLDTGFHVLSHSYYTNYFPQVLNSSITHLIAAADTTNASDDSYGHGTAIFSNLLSTAPGGILWLIKTNLISIALNEVLSRPQIQILSMSIGYADEGGLALECQHSPPPNCYGDAEANTEYNELQQLYSNGVLLVGAAGNLVGTAGILYFPLDMPVFLSVGGSYWDGTNFLASSYASSGNSILYPNRHIPDVTGLVGQAPYGIYIQMPTQPSSEIDAEFANFGDGTGSSDGWIVASGTSSATPQVAGLAAAIIQLRGSTISNTGVKTLIENSATDITQGQSANGQSAGPGYDAATGWGLINFKKALLATLSCSASANPTVGTNGYVTPTFRGSCVGGFPPYGYYWQFNDGSGAYSTQNPATYTYTCLPGVCSATYYPTLRVTDAAGTVLTPSVSVITVSCRTACPEKPSR